MQIKYEIFNANQRAQWDFENNLHFFFQLSLLLLLKSIQCSFNYKLTHNHSQKTDETNAAGILLNFIPKFRRLRDNQNNSCNFSGNVAAAAPFEHKKFCLKLILISHIENEMENNNQCGMLSKSIGNAWNASSEIFNIKCKWIIKKDDK